MKAILKLCCTIVALSALSLPLFGEITLDTSFNPGTGANGLVETTIVQPDGKILVCGNFTSFNNTSHAYIARLNRDGSIDNSFNANVGYWVRHMALQSDGKIVIGGFFTDVQGVPRNRIARLNPNGSLDTSFNPGSGCQIKIVPPDPWEPFVFAVAVQPDGKILIGGNFVTYNGVTNVGIVRVNSNGSLDSTFNVGAGVNSWVRSILVQQNGKIMLTGWFTSYDNHFHSRMVLLNANGTADTTFNPNFGELTAVYTVAQLSGGKYIVAGHSANTNDPGYWAREIARLNPDGTFDTSFQGSANEKVESIKIQPDGKIVMGGYFSEVCGVRRWNVARLNADGSLDTDFTPQTDNYVWTIALQSDGRILACGGFNNVDGVSRNGIARFADASAVGDTPVLNFVAQTPDGRVAAITTGDHIAVQQLSKKPLNPRNRLVIVDDLDNDGHSDFVWQQITTGSVSVWYMDGTNILRTAVLTNQPSARGWRVAASGDFNSDGQKDLLLQKGVNLSFWFLNGTNVDTVTNPPKQRGAGWRVAGATDMNNDNHPDLLWQHPAGFLAISHLDGVSFIDSAVLSKRVPGGWIARAVGDLHSNTKPDVLFQSGAGALARWTFNDTNYVSSKALGRVSPAWRIVGAN